MTHADKWSSDAIHTIGKRIKSRNIINNFWKPIQREQCSGKEKYRHDDEVHKQLESLHIFKFGCDSCPECRKQYRYQKHKSKCHNDHGSIFWPESYRHRNEKYHDSLQWCNRCSTKRSADHDFISGNGSYQGFFEKSKLPVPDDFYSIEHGGK